MSWARGRGLPRLARRLLAAIGAALAGLWVVAGPGTGWTEPGADDAATPSRPGPTGDPRAWRAPLAESSLLLDGTLAGHRLVAVGQRGHVLLSEDGGASWRQVVVPTSAMLTAVAFPDAEHGWAVGHGAVILHTANGGDSWEVQHQDSALDSPLLDVHFANERRGFAVGAYGLFLETEDGGATWEQRSIDDRDAHYYAIAAANERLYIAGEFGTVLVSSDEGATWEPVPAKHEVSLFGALPLPGGDVLLFGLRGHAFRLDTDDNSLHDVPTGTLSSLMGGAVGEDGRVLLGGAGGVLLSGDPAPGSFEMTRRPDRQTVTDIVVTAAGTPLILGEFGVDAVSGSMTPTRPSGPLEARRR